MQSLSRTLLVRTFRGGRTRPLVHDHHNHRRQLSYTPRAPPPLFDLCVRKSFGQALQRAQTHPHEAAFKHPRNWTALHCCVEHVAPLDVVKAIYNAYPQNLTTKDWQGITPAEAAVDLETKDFLTQQVLTSSAESTSSINNDPKSLARANDAGANTDESMLLGKVITHAENMSNQVAQLSSTTKNLQKELEDLKATLRAMSNTKLPY